MPSRLRIQPIGTNGAFTQRGFNTNYLVSLGTRSAAKEFLFDAGTTAGVAMQAIEREFVEISEVYISHLHLDHVGGLVQLGLRRYSAGLEPPKLYCCKDLASKIWPMFLQTFMEIALSQEGNIQKFGLEDFFQLIELPPQNSKLDSSALIADINCAPVEFSHPNSSSTFGLIIEEKVLLTSDMASAQYLAGTEIDYVSSLQGSGFKFNNPNAKRTCGCGSSFS